VQVLDDREPCPSVTVRLSIGKTYPGGRIGIFGDEALTDEDGHASFEIPEYDKCWNKYVNFKIKGTWYGSWDLAEGACGYTVDVASDSESEEEEETADGDTEEDDENDSNDD